MCRALSDGGRRCPCSNPARRSAYRKAARAAKTATSAVIGTGGSTTTIDILPDLTEAWQPARVTQLATDANALTTATSHLFPVGKIPHDGREQAQQLLHKHTVHCAELQQELDATLQRAIEHGIDDPDTLVQPQRRRLEYAQQQIQNAQQALTMCDLADQYGLTGSGTSLIAHAEHLTRQVGAAIAAEAQRRAGIDLTTWVDAETQRRAQQETRALDANAEYDAARRAYQHLCSNQDTCTPTELEQAQDRYAQASAARTATARALTDIPDEHRTQLRTLAHEYQHVLTELRDMGAQAKFHKKTTKQAAAAFQEAMHVFPTDWVHAHNAGDPVYARVSKTRAHYHPGRRLTTNKRVNVGHIWEGEPDGADSPYRSIQPVEDSPEFRAAAAACGLDPDTVLADVRGSGEQRWLVEKWQVATRWEHGDFTDEAPPRGRGWQRHEERATDGSSVVRWRRRATRMQPTSIEMVPELTTNTNPAVNRDGSDTYSTCLHEFSHRCEKVVPQIPRLEHAFLTRRTTRDDGTREALIRLYPGKSEYARPDRFADAYIGKEYERPTSTEVLSMGMETVFAGNYGAGVGVGRYRDDLDLRDFVLGVLATAGRPTPAP